MDHVQKKIMQHQCWAMLGKLGLVYCYNGCTNTHTWSHNNWGCLRGNPKLLELLKTCRTGFDPNHNLQHFCTKITIAPQKRCEQALLSRVGSDHPLATSHATTKGGHPRWIKCFWVIRGGSNASLELMLADNRPKQHILSFWRLFGARVCQ